jgi:hypothetical protein
MTTTRRRSSVGSTAAAAAPDPPAGATTPNTSPRRSSRRRTSLLVRRESDALDLGLLGRASPGAASSSSGVESTPSRFGGMGAFRFFEDDEEEGGVLVLGGWRLRPMPVLGSLFILGLFTILTLLTLYPGVSEGLSKDVSARVR